MSYKNIIILISFIYSILNVNANNIAHKVIVRPFKVELFELYDSFSATGQAKYKQSRTYYANVEGRISQIYQSGANFNVKSGEIILAIDPEVANSLKAQKEAALEAARLSKIRSETLYNKKFTSSEALETSKSKLAEALAALASANITYNDMIITAPFAGEVGTIAFRIGDSVKKGDYLFSLINKNEVNVFLELPETLQGQVNDKTVVILTDNNENSAKAIVVATTPYISDKGTMQVEVLAAPENKFIHGTYLNAEFIINKHSGLAIPERAVLKNEKGNFIYKIVDNVIKQFYVDLGMRTNNMIEVLSKDIQEGDQIVLEGLTKVQEGTSVEVVN